MEEPECAVTQLAPAAEGSPKEVELPPSRWDSPKSPTPERPVSPEPNCAICLGALENKSFTNSCMHQFCFVCLLEWSKVKAECPLCKNSFKSIIHNVRSMEDYDQYEVLCPAPSESSNGNGSNWARFMTEWHSLTSALAHGDMQAIPSGHRPLARTRRDRNVAGTSAFRRNIYDEDLWARMQPDVTGRYRECCPAFYRNNPAQLHRLVPFLQRELNVLVPYTDSMPAFVETILQKLRHQRINGPEFRTFIRQVVGPRHAAHFCHELHAFASSPFDLVGYDRLTEYLPNNNNNFLHPDLVEVIEDTPSSSGGSNSDDTDSEVEMLTRSRPAFSVTVTPHGETTSIERRGNQLPDPASPQPGPSGLYAGSPRRCSNCDSSVYVVDSSDSDECTVVGVVKPRHERTPLIITLSSPEKSPCYSPISPQAGPSCSYQSDASSTFSCVKPKPQDFSLSESSPEHSPELCNVRKRKARKFNWSTDGSEGEGDRSPVLGFRCSGPWHSESGSESSPERDLECVPRKKPAGGESSSSSAGHRSRLLSVATKVPSPRDARRVRYHREARPTSFHDRDSDPSDEDDGPSTSYGSPTRLQQHHRLTSVLQRTSSTTGGYVWTVSAGRGSGSRSRSGRGNSGTSSRYSSPEFAARRRSRRRSTGRDRDVDLDRSESSGSNHSRHRRRDSSSKSKKKHKKSSRTKSKKRKHESSRKDRCKKSKRDSDE